jgi:hypothetical protein
MKRLFGSILRLGPEAVSRLAAFGLYAYISRAFGVELLGIVALSQTIAFFGWLGAWRGGVGLLFVLGAIAAIPQGLEGIMVRRKNRSRFVLSFDLLHRAVAIEMNAMDLQPAN